MGSKSNFNEGIAVIQSTWLWCKCYLMECYY